MLKHCFFPITVHHISRKVLYVICTIVDPNALTLAAHRILIHWADILTFLKGKHRSISKRQLTPSEDRRAVLRRRYDLSARVYVAQQAGIFDRPSVGPRHSHHWSCFVAYRLHGVSGPRFFYAQNKEVTWKRTNQFDRDSFSCGCCEWEGRGEKGRRGSLYATTKCGRRPYTWRGVRLSTSRHNLEWVGRSVSREGGRVLDPQPVYTLLLLRSMYMYFMCILYCLFYVMLFWLLSFYTYVCFILCLSSLFAARV